MKTHRLEIARDHIGSYRCLTIDTAAILDPDGATGARAELEAIRSLVAAEAGCDEEEAGTIAESPEDVR